MIRSLVAIIVAVITGLATSRGVEILGAGISKAELHSSMYLSTLMVGWFFGALFAALIAILLGRRWAPLGGLAAVAIFLNALITIVSNPLSWVVWPGAIVATLIGGYLAITLTGASMVHPDRRRKKGLFVD